MILFLVHRAADADDARALAWRLRWHDCTPAAIWAGPDERSALTAAILADVLEWPGTIEVHDDLTASQADPAHVLGRLHDASPGAPGFAVVVIGSEPLLSLIVARRFEGPRPEPLAPGEALRIDDHELRWRFSHDGAGPVRGPEPTR